MLSNGVRKTSRVARNLVVDDADDSLLVKSVGGTAPTPTPPNAPTVFRASTVLPAAGAWTSSAAYATLGAKRVGFLVSYTGADAAGQVKYRFRKGFSSTLAALGTEEITPGDMTPNGLTGEKDVADEVSLRPVSGVTATLFTLTFDVEGGWTHCVLELAENGAPSSPGTAAITVAGSY
jgi:hypothetical protein